MVKIGLQIKALLENVTNLRPDGEDFRWYIKLKCANCGEITEDFSYLTLTESSPLKGGRGSASMVIKCKLCGRENSIDIIRESIKPYHIEDSNKFKTVVVFDCRGCEPVEFSPRVGFAADGEEGGQEFTEVDLNELEWFDYDEKKNDSEWFDYDEKKNDSVGITEFESRFVTVK